LHEQRKELPAPPQEEWKLWFIKIREAKQIKMDSGFRRNDEQKMNPPAFAKIVAWRIRTLIRRCAPPSRDGRRKMTLFHLAVSSKGRAKARSASAGEDGQLVNDSTEA
jgi:hypothetical protein